MLVILVFLTDSEVHTASHHESVTGVSGCDMDEDYVTSFTTFSSYWEVPDAQAEYVMSYKWALQEQQADGYVNEKCKKILKKITGKK